MALAGDTTAMRLCLERIYPARKIERYVPALPLSRDQAKLST